MVPVAHFAVGMLPPFIISAALLPLKKRWLVYAPVVITFCGFWALIPDVPVYYARKLGGDDLRWFMHKKIGNLFFFHQALDTWKGVPSSSPRPSGAKEQSVIHTDSHDYPGGGVWGLMLISCMYFCIILAYIIYIRRLWQDITYKNSIIQALSNKARNKPSTS